MYAGVQPPIFLLLTLLLPTRHTAEDDVGRKGGGGGVSSLIWNLVAGKSSGWGTMEVKDRARF